MEALRAKGALGRAEQLSEQADHLCQSTFITLHLLEASVRSLHENLTFVVEENFDFKLIEVTDEQIED